MATTPPRTPEPGDEENVPPAVETKEDGDDAMEGVRGFTRGQLIDCQDSRGDWYEAIVCEFKESKIYVHFVHWTSLWDTWVDARSSRLAPHGSKIYMVGGVLAKGQKIEVYDQDPTQLKWCEATVVDETVDKVKVHFKGWAPKFDEWIPRDSDRIAPFGTNVRGRIAYRPKPATYWSTHQRAVNWGTHNGDMALRQYKDALGRLGMRVRQVDGDGNCLFRSVSHQVYGTEDHHFMIRQRACDYMLIEKEWFNSFVVGDLEGFMRYIEEKRQNRVWGDDPEIQAMCEIFDRPAEIYAFDQTSGARLLRTFHAARSACRPPIRLSYYGGGHYDSIVGTGFDESLLPGRPGDAEAAFLEAAQERSVRAVGAVRSSVDDTALETALALSREAFDANAFNLDAALQASLGGAPIGAAFGSVGPPPAMPGVATGVPTASVVPATGGGGDMAAIEASRLAEFQRQRDERELEAALEASRHMTDAGAMGEDEALRQAMMLSLASTDAADPDIVAAIQASTDAADPDILAVIEAASRAAAGAPGSSAAAPPPPAACLLSEEEQLRMLQADNTDDAVLEAILERSRLEAMAAGVVDAAAAPAAAEGGAAAEGSGAGVVGGAAAVGGVAAPAVPEPPPDDEWPSDQPRP